MAKTVETRLHVTCDNGEMAGLKWSREGDEASAPALIFCHANGFCASTYRALLQPLAEMTGLSVVALDLRGHGRTSLPADPECQDSWNNHARDIAQAVTALAPQGCVLAGHSMGATSALLAGARLGGQVKGLVLLDPVLAPQAFYLYARLPWVFNHWRKHFPMARNASRRRANFESRAQAIAAYTGRGAFKTWPVSVIADYCEDGLVEVPDGGVSLSCAPAFEAACFAGQRHNPLSALQRLSCPVHLLRGGTFSTTAAVILPFLKRHKVRVDTLKDNGHFLPMEAPEVCRAAMAEMLGLV